VLARVVLSLTVASAEVGTELGINLGSNLSTMQGGSSEEGQGAVQEAHVQRQPPQREQYRQYFR
jgi:hypothetical protein